MNDISTVSNIFIDISIEIIFFNTEFQLLDSLHNDLFETYLNRRRIVNAGYTLKYDNFELGQDCQLITSCSLFSRPQGRASQL